MVDDRKMQAIQLRSTGLSIKAIARKLNAAQSSVSIWVRNVSLTSAQVQKLRANTHSPVTIEKRRQSRLKNELKKRTTVIEGAKKEVQSLTKRELWLIGTGLYWAEGGKTQSYVRFTNGDPKMILLMMRYFIEICEVDPLKIKGHIHIHEHLDAILAEQYWQKITKIKKEKFYKTYNKPNKSSKGSRKSLPYGVCDLYVLDANLLLRISGWTEGIYESAMKMV